MGGRTTEPGSVILSTDSPTTRAELGRTRSVTVSSPGSAVT